MTLRFVRALLTAGVLLVAAVAAAGGDVLAEVAGRHITVGDLEREMARRGGGRVFADPGVRQALLAEMVESELLLAAAVEAGYDRDPEAVAVFERMVAARYQSDALDALLAGVTVDDGAVAAYYQDHQDAYARPTRVQAAMIYFALPATAGDERRQEVLALAERVRGEALALDPGVRHFGTLAVDHSDDRASRYRGGVIGWLVEHPDRSYRWDPAVVEAIFQLSSPGAISPLITTDDGLYLVRLVEREGSTPQPLERVRDGIRHQLVQAERDRLRAAFFADLRARLPVAVDEALLATVAAPSTDRNQSDLTPPPVPAS
jgi:parvulin-like peptidyl-prolyl isomerase